MTNPSTTTQLSTPHILHPMTNPIAVTREGSPVVSGATGARITIGGRELYDMLSGLGCVNVGYGNKAICDAAYEAMLNLSYAHGFAGQTNKYNVELSDKLVELTNGAFPKFFFASTGSDANESAIKIALRYWRLKGQPDRRVFLSRELAYHGNTVMATSLTGMGHYHSQFGLPMSEWVRHVKTAYPYRDKMSPEKSAAQAAQSLEDMILSVGAGRIAAFFVEPIQATGSMVMPPEGYLGKLRAICDKYDILMITDEVVTGFGKTGSMFAYQHFGFKPDMLVMAKGLTSTYFPMSAVGLSQKVMTVISSADEDFEHGFTNCGHPVGSATALANIKVIEEGQLLNHVNTVLAPIMKRRMSEMSKESSVGETRTIGIFGAIEFDVGERHAESKAFCDKVGAEAYARGVIVRPLESSLAFVVPLVTSAAELEEVFDIIDASITAVSLSQGVAEQAVV
jgi:putrescine---pyruvate transaminase